MQLVSSLCRASPERSLGSPASMNSPSRERGREFICQVLSVYYLCWSKDPSTLLGVLTPLNVWCVSVTQPLQLAPCMPLSNNSSELGRGRKAGVGLLQFLPNEHGRVMHKQGSNPGTTGTADSVLAEGGDQGFSTEQVSRAQKVEPSISEDVH